MLLNNFKTILPGTLPLATDVDQLRQALSGIADVGPLSLCAVQAIPNIPSITSSGVGNLNGAYYYETIIVTGFQQSDGSFYVNGFVNSGDSNQVTIANGQGSIANIALGSVGTIGRAIYRTIASGAKGSEQFAFMIWDNTTTSFMDNTLDGNLGTSIPNSSTTPAVYGSLISVAAPTINTTGTQLLQLTQSTGGVIVTTGNGAGAGLFSTINATYILWAWDKGSVNHLMATGYKGGSGTTHSLSVNSSVGLTLGSSNSLGTQAITGVATGEGATMCIAFPWNVLGI